MAAQVQPLSVIAVEVAKRRRIVDSALGTTLAEGVSPGPEVIALAERFVLGEITLEEMGSAIRSMSGLQTLPVIVFDSQFDDANGVLRNKLHISDAAKLEPHIARLFSARG